MKFAKTLLQLFLVGVLATGNSANCAESQEAKEFKVLVVMSYEEKNPWVKEIREGIDASLKATSEIFYQFLDAKVDRPGGPKKAADAYELYQRIQPDGVIAADDDAQAWFVVPFLKDKVRTPVMFNGVNGSAEKYGYPASNVSGVLERAHVRESLAFIKQILPSIQSICFMTNDVPSGRDLRTQVESEKAGYPAKVNAFYLVKSAREIEELEKKLQAGCDTLFTDSLEGIVDDAAKPMNHAEITQVLSKVYRGPILGGNHYQVEQGSWAAVVKTGQEQGEKSGAMLLKAMHGTPLANLPIVQNNQGRRVINVSALDSRGVTIPPTVLRGSTLVRQQP